MNGLLSSPLRALAAGGVVAALALALSLIGAHGDYLGLASFVFRFAHIVAAMLWVGMIWFVNFIQLVALSEADGEGRAAIMRHVVPRVGGVIRHASHLVVASGIGLLVTTGYMLDRIVFPSAVYIPPLRGGMLWAGVAVGLAMWGLVHFAIAPSLRVLLDPEDRQAAQVSKARERVRLAARINLMLAVPVTFVMVAAAHLY